MKILQVISSFPPAYSYGGPLQQSFQLCCELVKRGHNVTVYTTDVFDAKNRMVIRSNPTYLEGIEIYRFKNISNILAYTNFPCAPNMAFALRKNLKKYDIIHIQEYRSFQTILAHHYAKKNAVPYVFQARGSIGRLIRLQKSKQIYDRIWGRIIGQDASKCIPTSKIEAEQYKTIGVLDKNIEIIPNAIDLSLYQSLPKFGEFRRKYKIKLTEKIILSVGRIHAIKGLDLLISAFADLEKSMENIKLVIVGPDEGLLAELIQLSESLGVRGKVIFTGPLYGEQKMQAYTDADIFVLSSKSENFGNVVIEAVACGIPSIVTKVCGVAELVSPDIGYVINYDKNELYECLFDALSNEKKLSIHKEIREKFLEQLKIEKICDRFEKVYQNII